MCDLFLDARSRSARVWRTETDGRALIKQDVNMKKMLRRQPNGIETNQMAGVQWTESRGSPATMSNYSCLAIEYVFANAALSPETSNRHGAE